MNFFERLKKQYYHTDPVEHIIGPQIIKVAEYDDLYENQTRFDGTVWKNFKEKQNLKCVFHEDLRDIDRAVDIMCLWFFRERTDRDAGNDIKLAGQIIKVAEYDDLYENQTRFDGTVCKYILVRRFT